MNNTGTRIGAKLAGNDLVRTPGLAWEAAKRGATGHRVCHRPCGHLVSPWPQLKIPGANPGEANPFPGPRVVPTRSAPPIRTPRSIPPRLSRSRERIRPPKRPPESVAFLPVNTIGKMDQTLFDKYPKSA